MSEKKIDRLDLKIVYKCNNFCRFCVNSKNDRNLPGITKHDIKTKLREGRRKGAVEVAFSGGEPTIRKDIIELVKFSKETGYETIMLITNGRMLSDKNFAHKIIDAGANKFMVSIHGNEKTHDYLTRTNGSFKQTIDGIKNIKSHGATLITETVVNKLNYKKLPETINNLVSYGSGICQIDFVIPSGEAIKNKDEIIPKYEETTKYVYKTIENLKINGNSDKIIVMGFPKCFMQGYESYMNEPNIPNIKISSEKDEQNTKNYNQHRAKNKIKTKKCQKCKDFYTCEGIWKNYLEIHGSGKVSKFN